MKIRKISALVTDAQQVPALLDSNHIRFQQIGCVNWETYPYKPAVFFRIAHTGKTILLHYRVTERSVRAKYTEDNSMVCRDSCVEFFLMPANDGIYYNIECNCAGVLKLAAGINRYERETASLELLKEVKRWSSLPITPFEEKYEETAWEIAIIIPCSAFFKHTFSFLDGMSARGNFYKCGDELQTPHFLSWQPIHLPSPDFHSPSFFSPLEFEF